MLPAPPDRMRTAFLVPLFGILAGCGGDASSVEGTLLGGGSGGQVWVDGETDRISISEAGFRIEDVSGDTIDLQFVDADGETGRMRILGLPDGALLTLRDVWIENDVAFPTEVNLNSGATISVNGLRMSTPGQVTGQITAAGTLLALSNDAEALILRPDDADMADLRVVVTPGTVLQSVDGEPVSLALLKPGDSLAVGGSVQGGYLVAAEVTVPRAVAAGVGLGGSESRAPARQEDEIEADDSDDEEVDRAEPRRNPGPRSRPGGRRF